jgi:hypothetical protein
MGADKGNIGGRGRIIQGGGGVPIPRASRGKQAVLGRLRHHDFGGVTLERRPHALGNEIVENLSRPYARFIGHVLVGFVLRGYAHQGDALALAIIGIIEQVLGVSAVIGR